MVFDVWKNIFGNYLDTGVIDSTYNMKTILNDALSLAHLLLNNGFMITKDKVHVPSSMKNYKHLSFM